MNGKKKYKLNTNFTGQGNRHMERKAQCWFGRKRRYGDTNCVRRTRAYKECFSQAWLCRTLHTEIFSHRMFSCKRSRRHPFHRSAPLLVLGGKKSKVRMFYFHPLFSAAFLTMWPLFQWDVFYHFSSIAQGLSQNTVQCLEGSQPALLLREP